MFCSIIPITIILLPFVLSLNPNHRHVFRDDPAVPVDFWLKQQLRTHQQSSESASAAVKSGPAPRVPIPPGLKPAVSAKVSGLPPGLKPAVVAGSQPPPVESAPVESSITPEFTVGTEAAEEVLSTTTEAATSWSTEPAVTAQVPDVPLDLSPAVNSASQRIVSDAGSRPSVNIPLIGGRRALRLPTAGRTFTFAVNNTLENRERTKAEAFRIPNSGSVRNVIQTIAKNVTLEDTPNADNSSTKPKIRRIITTAEDVTQNENDEVDISFGPASRSRRQIGLNGGLGIEPSLLPSTIGISDTLVAQKSWSDVAKKNATDKSRVASASASVSIPSAGSEPNIGLDRSGPYIGPPGSSIRSSSTAFDSNIDGAALAVASQTENFGLDPSAPSRGV